MKLFVDDLILRQTKQEILDEKITDEQIIKVNQSYEKVVDTYKDMTYQDLKKLSQTRDELKNRAGYVLFLPPIDKNGEGGLICLDSDDKEDPINKPKTTLLKKIIYHYLKDNLPAILNTPHGAHFWFRLPKGMSFKNLNPARLPFLSEVDIKCSANDLVKNKYDGLEAYYQIRISYLALKTNNKDREWEHTYETIDELPELPFWLFPQSRNFAQGEKYKLNINSFNDYRNVKLASLSGSLSALRTKENERVFNDEQIDFIKNIVNEFLCIEKLSQTELNNITIDWQSNVMNRNLWIYDFYATDKNGNPKKLLFGKFSQEMIKRFGITRLNDTLHFWNFQKKSWMIDEHDNLSILLDSLFEESTDIFKNNMIKKIQKNAIITDIVNTHQHKFVNFKNKTLVIDKVNNINEINDYFIEKSKDNFTVFEIPTKVTNKWHNNPPKIKVFGIERTIESIIRDDWMNKNLNRYQHIKQETCCIVMPHSKINKATFNIGNTHNGKGLFFETILQPLFGLNNILGVPLEYLENPFILAQTENKLLIYCDETDIKYFNNTGPFKMIVSGAWFKSEKKGKDATTAHTNAYLMCNFNTFPKVKNEKATRERIDSIKWENTFINEKKDGNLKSELLKKSKEICEWWLYECLLELKQMEINNWKFSWNEDELKNELFDEKDTYKLWLTEWHYDEQEYWVWTHKALECFKNYESFCLQQNLMCGSSVTFYDNIRNEFEFDKKWIRIDGKDNYFKYSNQQKRYEKELEIQEQIKKRDKERIKGEQE